MGLHTSRSIEFSESTVSDPATLSDPVPTMYETLSPSSATIAYARNWMCCVIFPMALLISLEVLERRFGKKSGRFVPRSGFE
jgi:hypothetical protein